MTEFSGDLGGGNPDRPRFAAIGLPDAGEPVWTPDRIGRHELLITKSKGVNGLLGRLYGTAVNLLPQLDVPGSMTLLAHCVREGYNRYPNFDGFTVPKMQGSRNAAVKSLVEMWVAVEDRAGELTADLMDGLAGDPLLTIRRSEHVAVDTVVHFERAATEAAQERHRYYVNGTTSAAIGASSGPSEAEANRCFKFFQSYTHVGLTLHRFEQEEAEQQFALFERLLDNRLEEFLNASDEVDELLAEVNTRRPTNEGDADE